MNNQYNSHEQLQASRQGRRSVSIALRQDGSHFLACPVPIRAHAPLRKKNQMKCSWWNTRWRQSLRTQRCVPGAMLGSPVATALPVSELCTTQHRRACPPSPRMYARLGLNADRRQKAAMIDKEWPQVNMPFLISLIPINAFEFRSPASISLSLSLSVS